MNDSDDGAEAGGVSADGSEWPSGGFDAPFGAGVGFGSEGSGTTNDANVFGVPGSGAGAWPEFSFGGDGSSAFGDSAAAGESEKDENKPKSSGATFFGGSSFGERRVPAFGESFAEGGGARQSSTEEDGFGSARGLTRVQRFEADLAEAAVRASGGSSEEAEKKRDATSVPLEEDTNEEDSKKEKTLKAAVQLQKMDTKEALASQAELAKQEMQQQLEHDHAQHRAEDIKIAPELNKAGEEMGFAPTSGAEYSFGQPASLKFSFNTTQGAPSAAPVASSAASTPPAPSAASAVTPTSTPIKTVASSGASAGSPVPDLSKQSQSELEALLQKTTSKVAMYNGMVPGLKEAVAAAADDAAKLVKAQAQLIKYSAILQTVTETKRAIEEELLKRFHVVADLKKEEEVLQRRYNLSEEPKPFAFDGKETEDAPEGFQFASGGQGFGAPSSDKHSDKKPIKKKDSLNAEKKEASAGKETGGEVFVFGAPDAQKPFEFGGFKFDETTAFAAKPQSPVSSSPAAKPAASGWACLACETENVASATSCSICALPKASDADRAKAAARDAQKAEQKAAAEASAPSVAFGSGGFQFGASESNEFVFGGVAPANDNASSGFQFGAASSAADAGSFGFQAPTAAFGVAEKPAETVGFAFGEPNAFSAGAAQAGEGGGWVCLACEAENAASAQTCKVCMLSKPTDEQRKKAEAAAKPQPVTFGSPSAATGGGAFAAEAPKNEGFAFAFGPEASPDTSFGFAFDAGKGKTESTVSAGRWACLACESDNASELQTCPVCMVPKPSDDQRLKAAASVKPGAAKPEPIVFNAPQESAGFAFGADAGKQGQDKGFSFDFGGGAEKFQLGGSGSNNGGFAFGGPAADEPFSFGGSLGGFCAPAFPAAVSEPKKEELTQSLTESDAFGKFGSDNDHWKCTKNDCDTVNPASAKACIVCDVPRQATGAVAEETKKEEKKEEAPAFDFGAAPQGDVFQMANFDLGVQLPSFDEFKFDANASAFAMGKEVPKSEDDGEERAAPDLVNAEEEQTTEGEGGDEDEDGEDGEDGEGGESDSSGNASTEEEVGKGGRGVALDEDRARAKSSSSKRRDEEKVAVPDKDGGGEGGDDSINVDPENFAFNFGSAEANDNAGTDFSFGMGSASNFSFESAGDGSDFFKAPEATMPDFGSISRTIEPESEKPKPAAVSAPASAPAPAPAGAAAPPDGRKIVKAVRRRGGAQAAADTPVAAAAEPPQQQSESPFPALGETPAKDQGRSKSMGGSGSGAPRKIEFSDE